MSEKNLVQFLVYVVFGFILGVFGFFAVLLWDIGTILAGISGIIDSEDSVFYTGFYAFYLSRASIPALISIVTLALMGKLDLD